MIKGKSMTITILDDMSLQHKGERMKQDIWVLHANKKKAIREEQQLKNAELHKKMVAKTRCDNCGKFGATRVQYGINYCGDNSYMAGFSKNLCNDCRARFSKWHRKNAER